MSIVHQTLSPPKISSLILAAHVLILLSVSISYSLHKPPPPPPPPLKLCEVSSPITPSTTTTTTTTTTPTAATPADPTSTPKSTKTQTKQKKNTTTTTTSTTTTQPTKYIAKPTLSKEAIQKAQNLLAPSASTNSLSPPTTLRLEIEQESSSGYLSLLIETFEKHLVLPEYGDVVVGLTLEKSGNVRDFTIVEAKSSMNKKYVEKVLPTLAFPKFSQGYEHEEHHLFTVVLHSR